LFAVCQHALSISLSAFLQHAALVAAAAAAGTQQVKWHGSQVWPGFLVVQTCLNAPAAVAAAAAAAAAAQS
jgi:uncharacterized membrane-anchored protein YitT (DUF2179 family)